MEIQHQLQQLQMKVEELLMLLLQSIWINFVMKKLVLDIKQQVLFDKKEKIVAVEI